MEKTRLVLIAVDTNVLFDRATDDADVIDALATIRARLKAAEFIVTPTVLEELAALYEKGTEVEQNAAERAIVSLAEWGFRPLNLIPAGHGIVEQIALSFRLKGILPDEEMNDGLIIAEAALLGCALLLSADTHLLEAQAHPMFRGVLKDSHAEGDGLVIATPRHIARQFFQSK